MGVQVHKFLGYGLTNVRTEKMEITDERVNPQSWLITRDGEPTPAEYQTWLESHTSRRPGMDVWYLRDTEKPRDLGYCIAWEPEFGLPEVLVLQPVACEDWRRRGDPIDYTAETWLRPGRQGNHVEPIGTCLYPYLTYMDDRTGEPVPDEIFQWVRVQNSGQEGDDHQAMLEITARAAGFSNNLEAEAHVWPMVPEEVRNLIEFAELFTSETAWRQLRPVLYTYWS